MKYYWGVLKIKWRVLKFNIRTLLRKIPILDRYYRRKAERMVEKMFNCKIIDIKNVKW